MHSMIRVATALVLSLSCATMAAAQDDRQTSNAQDEGQTSNACWLAAARNSDADAVSECYADDAVLWLPGGGTAQGRDAIREAYAGYFDAFSVKDVELMEMGSKAMEDTVVTWGTFRMVMTPKAGGDDVVETGRYTDVSQNVDGKWVYLVDHASDDPAPTD